MRITGQSKTKAFKRVRCIRSEYAKKAEKYTYGVGKVLLH